MGANNSSLTPLNCILKNWDRFDPWGLKKTHLVFLSDNAWLQYPMEDGRQWPVWGSLKYNTVLQVYRFCRKQRKLVEVAYMLPFFSLWNSKLLLLHEAPTGRNNQSTRVNKPFSYQEIQRIREDLGYYLEDPEKYIRAFKGVTLLYDLTWKDVIYILGQTLTQKLEF